LVIYLCIYPICRDHGLKGFGTSSRSTAVGPRSWQRQMTSSAWKRSMGESGLLMQHYSQLQIPQWNHWWRSSVCAWVAFTLMFFKSLCIILNF